MKSTVFFILATFLIWNETEAGVQQCYYCEEKCDDPIPTKDCVQADEIDYVCLSEEIVQGEAKFEFKDCSVNTENVKYICGRLNETEGNFCSLCAEDLCNV